MRWSQRDYTSRASSYRDCREKSLLCSFRSCTSSILLRSGSDGPYKEFKVLTFYDPDKSHCHVVGTSGDCEAAGRLMRREASRLHLDQAKVKYGVSDGAEWIAHQYQRQLPMLDEHILDYYHLRDHVVQTSYVLYGQGTQQAEQWREQMMGTVWEQGSLVMLDRLGSYLRRHRTGSKHDALESLRDFVSKRVAMTDYPTFRQLGYDCGSGPTESSCGRLTDRLKGHGMRWDKSNAEAMMALAGLYHSGLWDTYWKPSRRPNAARIPPCTPAPCPRQRGCEKIGLDRDGRVRA